MQSKGTASPVAAARRSPRRGWAGRAHAIAALVVGTIGGALLPHAAPAPASAVVTPPEPGTGTPAPEPTPEPTVPPAPEPSPSAPPSESPAATPAEPTASPTPGATPEPETPVEGAPTWDAVGQAAGNTVAAASLIDQISGQIASLDAAVAESQQASVEAGARYEQARTAAEDRRSDVMLLDAQILEAEEQADSSAASLGTMAAHLRNHTGGFTPEIATVFNTDPEGDFLYRVTAINRFSDNEAALLEAAVADGERLDGLRAAAQVALDEAVALETQALLEQATAAAAQLALEAQQSAAIAAKAEFERMLGVLGEGRAPTQGDLDAVLAAQTEAFTATQEAFRAAGLTAAPGASASGTYAPMLGGAISSGFGMRIHPVHGDIRMHWGTDYVQSSGGTCGAPLFAAIAGTVTYAGPMGGYGNVVQIDDGKGTKLLYGHILNGGVGVKTGETVAAGQPIALTGSTGTSTGCHLHFEVERSGARLDPHSWLIQQGVAS